MKFRRSIARLACLFAAPLVAAACTGGGAGGDDDGGPDGGVDVEPCDLPTLGGQVSTLSGCEDPGAIDGPRGVARFANPVNVIGGPDGVVFVADFDNDRVRVVQPDGTTSTLIEQQGFARPFGLALVGSTLYIQTDDNDAGEHSAMTGTIWRISTSGGEPEVIVRDIGRPRGLLALPDGRIAMADYMHHALRILDPDTGQVSNLAGAFDQEGYADGRGGSARFNGPYGLALLGDGRIAVADYFNHRIRAVSLNGDVTTLAGGGSPGDVDGRGAAARFAHPQGMTSDIAGNVYLTDTDNFSIRRITPSGEVTTIVGGTSGWRDGSMSEAQFHGLEGLDVSDDGDTLWVADGSRGEDAPYHRVRVVELP